MDKKAPIKSIVITGNLNNTDLKYQLCPVNEFSEGVWNIAILSIAYLCSIQNFKEHCQISCNLATSQKFSENFQVELYQEPFALFTLEEVNKTIYFGKTFGKFKECKYQKFIM